MQTHMTSAWEGCQKFLHQAVYVKFPSDLYGSILLSNMACRWEKREAIISHVEWQNIQICKSFYLSVNVRVDPEDETKYSYDLARRYIQEIHVTAMIRNAVEEGRTSQKQSEFGQCSTNAIHDGIVTFSKRPTNNCLEF